MSPLIGRKPPPPLLKSLAGLDEHEFGTLAEPYRRELNAHCYRMLGSVTEAEEFVQETLLRAWRRRETYQGRAPLRAWLYKIATNVCLDGLERRPRRSLPVARQAAASLNEPVPSDVAEPIWLEPFPDELFSPEEMNPEARYSMRESVTLAFMTSLHLLPPRQRAVLILRDVLDWPAREAADLLGLSVPAVKSALHRARSTLGNHYRARPVDVVTVQSLDAAGRGLLDRYVRAWETADVNELTALLKAEATFSMPPTPAWYRGREAIRALVSKTIFGGPASGRWRLRPTRASGQTGFGLYICDDAGGYRAYGIQVVTFEGEEIADIVTFRSPELFRFFELPATWPG
jgi:RNA polymerase sigma-70 factor (ECF subfamily)